MSGELDVNRIEDIDQLAQVFWCGRLTGTRIRIEELSPGKMLVKKKCKFNIYNG